ncbi:hypothetical protein EQ500_04805 [Lactobacillus sp. XV13L]|nr:hypothetical protein [Lactobacillus sp. XV13L]
MTSCFPIPKKRWNTFLTIHQPLPSQPVKLGMKNAPTFRLLHWERLGAVTPDTGYQVLRGRGQIQGRLWGGCIDTLYDDLTTTRYADEAEIIRRYHLILSQEEARAAVLFIESSEECPPPALYRKMLAKLDKAGILAAVRGIIVGKPQNKKYYEEYQQELLKATQEYGTPIPYSLNFGHAYPHAALPYGIQVQLDFDQRRVTILEPYFSN